MGAIQLDLNVKPQEFFREKVSEAAARQKLKMSDDVEFYVVNLLCEFIAPTKLETPVGRLDALETPLALMLREAVEAPPAQQLRIFKFLGDTSLYLAGFFQDYFNRKAFDIDYYISLGQNAYDNVSSLMRDVHGDDHFTEVYGTLASQFKPLVEVVADVSELPGNVQPLDILAVYDRWNRNQDSERLRAKLTNVGIIPIPTIRDKQ